MRIRNEMKSKGYLKSSHRSNAKAKFLDRMTDVGQIELRKNHALRSIIESKTGYFATVKKIKLSRRGETARTVPKALDKLNILKVKYAKRGKSAQTSDQAKGEQLAKYYKISIYPTYQFTLQSLTF